MDPEKHLEHLSGDPLLPHYVGRDRETSNPWEKTMKRLPTLGKKAAALLVAGVFAVTGRAEVPPLIHYQGRLLDGTNLVNGPISLVFRVYPQATSGGYLFADSNEVVAVDGLYAADLGAHPISGSLTQALAGGEAWLEVEVNGTTLAPRERILSVAFAINADQLDNLDASAFATGTPVYAESNPGIQGGVTNADGAFFVRFGTPFTQPPVVTLTPMGLEGNVWLAGTTTTGFSAVVEPAPDSFARSALVVDGTDDVGYYSSLALVNGKPAISYSGPNEPHLRYVISSNSEGTAWSMPITVEAGIVGYYPSLEVVHGKPAISYFDGGNHDLKYAQAEDVDGTGAWRHVTVDAAGLVGTFTSLAVVNGRPAISYYDISNQDLKYAIAGDADGTGGWTRVTVDAEGTTGEYTSLAVVNGKPAISYYTFAEDASNLMVTNGDLKYAIAGDADGTGGWTRVTVDLEGITGEYTSLAVVNGRPAISYSYYDYFNNRGLKYAQANTADGTNNWTRVTVDAEGRVGAHTSLAVVNGKPAISYYDVNNRDLKYACAGDTNGTSPWTRITLDSAEYVGEYTSLAMVMGRPAISYRSESGHGLKYARARTPVAVHWIAVEP